MNKTDIQIATSLLGKEGIVFAIVKDGEILFTSANKGIQPFFDALEMRNIKEYMGCSIADRVIGKAALLLSAYLGAKHIYTPLASEHAQAAARMLDLDLIYDKSCAFIINRTQDGMCPMENAVLDIDNSEQAYIALKNILQKLKSG